MYGHHPCKEDGGRKENTMSIIIEVNGECTIYGASGRQVLDKVLEIKDGWGGQPFQASGNIISFKARQIEGTDPIEDGVIKPLTSLVEWAKTNKANIEGDFTINSDWEDFNGICIEITGNELKQVDIRLGGYATEDLIAELKRRGEYKLKVRTPVGTIIAETHGAKDDYPGIWVMKDGNRPFNMMAAVEYNTTDARYQIEGYQAGADEVRIMIDYETGDDLL